MTELLPYYYFIYWFFVFLLTFRFFYDIVKQKGCTILYKKDNYVPLLIFSIFYILFFGFRPVSGQYFTDMSVYANNYTNFQVFGTAVAVDADSFDSDWLFFAFMKFCSHVMDMHLWFAIMMYFYIAMMFFGCRRIDINHGALLMLFSIGAFEFYTFSVNGIRNGVACSFVIFALGLLCNKKMWWAVFWSVIAIGCHKSTILPVAAMFFTYFVTKAKYMYIAWLGAIIVSLTIGGYIDAFLSTISYDDRLSSNLLENEADGLELEHRFRWDFLLYSSMPVILGVYTVFKRKIYNKTYLILLGTYMYANSFWLLAIRAIFSNRIAYLSWFIYPVVLAYPLLNFPVFKKNHSRKTAWILLGHFSFTTILWLLGK